MQAAQIKQAKLYIPRYMNEDESFWKTHIAAFSSSGLKKTTYCKANQLNYARFFYWIKKLSVQPAQALSVKSGLLPVQLKPESKVHDEILCTLILKNGCALQIHDQQSLSKILTMWG